MSAKKLVRNFLSESLLKSTKPFIREAPLFPPSVTQVATAVPAFIGYTEKAVNAEGESLNLIPTKVFSIHEYEAKFGKAPGESTITVDVQLASGKVTAAQAENARPSVHIMYYALRHYFDNGGRQCYIVSVGAFNGSITNTDLEDGLDALEAYDEPTLILFPEGQGMQEDHYYDLIGRAIDQCAKLQDRFTLVDIHTKRSTTADTINGFRTAFGKTDNLSYGAAYYPDLVTSYAYHYSDTDVDVVVKTKGTAPKAVSLNTLLSSNKIIYDACKAAILQLGLMLPPSPAVAGLYAQVDASRGVWKAPANISVSHVKQLSDDINHEEQNGLNLDALSGKSVNAFRTFAGQGILLWGARTLDENSSEYKYVHIRRFFNIVEESIKKASAHFVFEPNDANTWQKIKSMIENYLMELWKQGALAGAKIEEAFFVKIGPGHTMTSDDITNGKIIVIIGMAAVRPAEFTIIHITQYMQNPETARGLQHDENLCSS